MQGEVQVDYCNRDAELCEFDSEEEAREYAHEMFESHKGEYGFIVEEV